MDAANAPTPGTTTPANQGRFARRVAALIALAAIGAAVALAIGSDDDAIRRERPERAAIEGVWISADELAALPTEGAAWDELAERATADWPAPDIGDLDNNHDVHTLAGALYAVRTADAAVRDRVANALDDITGATSDELLPMARNLTSYVIAADLIGHDAPAFDDWLDELLDRTTASRAGITSLRESALRDPSNHGAHARAAAVAIGRHLGDTELVETVAARFHDWLGRSGDDFEWRERFWQSDPDRPVGINPAGALIDGADVDGVLPEEQRRGGEFDDPAPQEGYVWEGLQGTIVTAELLSRAGYDVWDWEDRALLRAFRWLYGVNAYPAEGDDRWIPWIVDRAYGTTYADPPPTRPGKNMGYADWTHGLARRG